MPDRNDVEISDKEIVGWIKNKEYSNLMFLENCWRSHKNEWYLGFYYFIKLNRH